MPLAPVVPAPVFVPVPVTVAPPVCDGCVPLVPDTTPEPGVDAGALVGEDVLEGRDAAGAPDPPVAAGKVCVRADGVVCVGVLASVGVVDVVAV